MKLPHQRQTIWKLNLKSYALYLLRPREFVLYLSMYLYSARLSCCGDTFFTTAIVKISKENLVWWTSRACIDNADFSQYFSLKHPRWPLVRSWHSCVVRPKYVSLSPHSLQIHMYIMFLDLQLRWRGMRIVLPLMTTWLCVFTWGHCKHPRPLQCWSNSALLEKLNCLLRTTRFPIELPFFSANNMRVSPMSCWNSSFRLRTSVLNSDTPSK